MASLVSLLDTEFTPAAGDFIAQVTGGVATLYRKNSAGVTSFAAVADIDNAVVVDNPVAGAVYKFTSTQGNPTVQADQ